MFSLCVSVRARRTSVPCADPERVFALDGAQTPERRGLAAGTPDRVKAVKRRVTEGLVKG